MTPYICEWIMLHKRKRKKKLNIINNKTNIVKYWRSIILLLSLVCLDILHSFCNLHVIYLSSCPSLFAPVHPHHPPPFVPHAHLDGPTLALIWAASKEVHELECLVALHNNLVQGTVTLRCQLTRKFQHRFTQNNRLHKYDQFKYT